MVFPFNTCRACLVALVIVGVSAPSAARQATTDPAQAAESGKPQDASKAPQAPKKDEPKPAPSVVSAVVVDSPGAGAQSSTIRAEMGDAVLLNIKGLNDWAAASSAPGDTAGKRDPRKFVLEVEGRQIVGVPVEAVNGETVTFVLRSTAENAQVWRALLGAKHPLTITVAPPGGQPFASAVTVRLERYKPATMGWTLLGFGVLVAGFVVLGLKSGMLRDGDANRACTQRPYSLGRCQMALWFFTILGSFIFLRLVTKTWDVVPTQAIVLMGISFGTGAAACVIDSSKTNEARTKLIELQSLPETTVAQKQQMKEVQAELNGDCSHGFLIDILSDSKGVSFHRFQMFSWTIVLWVMFAASVFRELIMPEFSDQLLTLLGISGGTYLGFKFPEKKAEPVDKVP